MKLCTLCLALAAVVMVTACSSTGAGQEDGLRTFSPFLDKEWIGNAICYGPYRDGQRPGGKTPSKAQMREDLRIISRHWKLLRMYGTTECSKEVLEIIRKDGLPLRVVLGAWLGTETAVDQDGKVTGEIAATKRENERQIAGLIELTNAYPDIVIGVSVGNEIRVFWSDHKVRPERLIDYIRRVRKAVRVPVTVADDFNYWNKPESRAVAAELDFIMIHLHPLWGGLARDKALAWTKRMLAESQAMHPGKTFVIGETGWATKKHTEGEQARLIKAEPSEADQALFYDEIRAWAAKTKTTTFFFEAFDENWKGGPHPNEVEKHWGVFFADRRPKRAMAPR